MKKILPILCSLWLLAGPAVTARSRAAKQADNPPATAAPLTAPAASTPATSTTPPASTAGGDDANADVNKTLDDVLAKPIESLVKEMPQPPREAASGEKDLLRGQAQVNAGAAEIGDNAGGVPGLQALQPKTAAPLLRGGASIGTLGGTANQNDPDLGDEQLAIEWDRWRNRFLRAVQMQVQASVNNPDGDAVRRRRFDPMTGTMILLPPFPLGTEAWFDCEVGRDGRLVRLSITQSSGFPAYDRAVTEGIRALEGTSLLIFPRSSRRLSVRQEAGIRTATTANYEYHNFGDVERYSTPRTGY